MRRPKRGCVRARPIIIDGTDELSELKRIALTGKCEDLVDNEEVKRCYLGGGQARKQPKAGGATEVET